MGKRGTQPSAEDRPAVAEVLLQDRGLAGMPNIERKVNGLTSYRALEVEVHDNDVEKALRQLKKKINDEGLFKTLKLKRSYEKPSEYRRRKERESRRRRNRMLARRRQRER